MSARRPWTLALVASPMVVWALHLVVVYSLEGLACARGWPLAPVAGMSRFNWLLVLVTAPALGTVAWLMSRGWRDARDPPASRDTGTGTGAARRQRLLAWVAMALAAVAAIAIVFATVPVFMLPPCTPEAL